MHLLIEETIVINYIIYYACDVCHIMFFFVVVAFVVYFDNKIFTILFYCYLNYFKASFITNFLLSMTIRIYFLFRNFLKNLL